MKAVFRRTRSRGYALDLVRERGEDLTMNPAPGYDDLLPHDLVHLLVEVHWGLRDGIFGHVADGGNAHTFRLSDERPRAETPRQTARKARQVRRGNRHGGSEMARSERLASVVHARWDQRHHSAWLPEWYDRELTASGADEAEVVAALDEAERLSARWRRVEVGQRLIIDWPWPERPSRQRSVAG